MTFASTIRTMRPQSDGLPPSTITVYGDSVKVSSSVTDPDNATGDTTGTDAAFGAGGLIQVWFPTSDFANLPNDATITAVWYSYEAYTVSSGSGTVDVELGHSGTNGNQDGTVLDNDDNEPVNGTKSWVANDPGLFPTVTNLKTDGVWMEVKNAPSDLRLCRVRLEVTWE